MVVNQCEAASTSLDGAAGFYPDGRTFRHHEKVNRGAGDRALSAAEIERKYFDNASLAISRSRAQAICDAVLALEQHSAAEFAQLLSGTRSGNI